MAWQSLERQHLALLRYVRQDKKVGSQVVGETKTDSLGGEQLGTLGEDEDDKEEPGTKRRREYTYLG